MDLDQGADVVTEWLMDVVFPERSSDEAFRGLLRHDADDNLDTMWRT